MECLAGRKGDYLPGLLEWKKAAYDFNPQPLRAVYASDRKWISACEIFRYQIDFESKMLGYRDTIQRICTGVSKSVTKRPDRIFCTGQSCKAAGWENTAGSRNWYQRSTVTDALLGYPYCYGKPGTEISGSYENWSLLHVSLLWNIIWPLQL